MHIKRICEMDSHAARTESVYDAMEYIGGMFPRTAEVLSDAAPGTLCRVSSDSFSGRNEYVWHVFLKERDNVWKEVEIRTVDGCDPVEDGASMTDSEIMGSGSGSLVMKLPAFDPDGEAVCVPSVHKAFNGECGSSKAVKVKDLVARYDGDVKCDILDGRAVLEFGMDDVYVAVDCEETRNMAKSHAE